MKRLLPIGVVLGVFAAALFSGCHGETKPVSIVTIRSIPPVPSNVIAQDTAEAAILTDIVQLTHGFDRAGEAYFSPDRHWIIFQASPHGQPHYQMYVAALKWEGDRIVGAGTPTRISPDNSRNTCGYFSPDGGSLLFASTSGKEKPDEKEGGYQREGRDYRWAFPAGMEIFRADHWLAEVQQAGGNDINLARHALTNNDAYDAECAFSPDGKWICFTSLRSNEGDIYVMRSDGSHVVQITDNPGYDGGPFFSPDGKRLVYRSDRQKNNLLQIYIADLQFDAEGNITGKAAEHQLTNDQNVNWGPYWHPDGKHLIFATSRQGHANYELYAMRDDGTHDVRITFTPGPDILPVFSPDGKYLMWTCKRSADQTTQIFAAKFHPPSGW
jgi:TolB protein